MEWLILILAILAVYIATLYRQEHMTNKDMLSAMQKYGTQDETPKKKDKIETPAQAPIYGPKAVAPEKKQEPSSSKSGKDTNAGVYPDIYGPEVVSVPGAKPAKHDGKSKSDEVSDDTYDYNPDFQKAFPTSGPPQPFLTDFSKFQR